MEDKTDPVITSGEAKVDTSPLKQPIFNQSLPRVFGWSKLWIFLVIMVLIIAGLIVIVASGIQRDKEQSQRENPKMKQSDIYESFQWPKKTAKYITRVPVELSQIQSISKYRSCAGHVRDGYNFDQELELDRTMKHYLLPVPEFQNTNDKVELFAPFDGTVIRLDLEKDKPDYGRKNAGNGIHLSTPLDPSIDFVIGHLYFFKEFKPGDRVKAGELLGYAATKCNNEAPGCDFDLDLSTLNGTSAYQGKEVLGSIFDHMNDSVLAEFAKFGITPENIKFSKEYRDAHPCGFYSETQGQQKSKEEAAKDVDGRHNDNFVQLKH